MEYNRTDIRNIAFEKINDRFSKGKYLGVEVTIDMSTGYINGNHLVKQALTKGGKPKRFDHWRENKETQYIINFISQNEGINTCDLIDDIMNVPVGLRGAYIHPFLVPHVAAWASPKLAHIVGRVINAIVCTNQIPSKLYTDPRVERKVGCVYFISDGKYTKIGYTYDLPKRLSCMQTANSNNLVVLKTILTEYPVELEERLHSQFASKLVRGEWYDISIDDYESIV